MMKWLHIDGAYCKYKGSSVGNQPDWWCSWPSCSFHCVSGIGVRTAAIWGRGGFWGPGYRGFYWLRPHSPHAGNCGSWSAVWGSAPSKSWQRDHRDVELYIRLSLNFVNIVILSQQSGHHPCYMAIIIYQPQQLLKQPESLLWQIYVIQSTQSFDLQLLVFSCSTFAIVVHSVFPLDAFFQASYQDFKTSISFSLEKY